MQLTLNIENEESAEKILFDINIFLDYFMR